LSFYEEEELELPLEDLEEYEKKICWI